LSLTELIRKVEERHHGQRLFIVQPTVVARMAKGRQCALKIFVIKFVVGL